MSKTTKIFERLAIALEGIQKAIEKNGVRGENEVTINVNDSPSSDADAFVWTPSMGFRPVKQIQRVPLRLLQGISYQEEALITNTEHFAQGLAANNALLWGARGTGKSSLVKAVHADVSARYPLILVEVNREDLSSLTQLHYVLRQDERRFIVFCDDLAFEGGQSSYKSLKATLEGGIEGCPPNVIFYATSNRRHLLAREMVENEQSEAINPAEVVEEKVSLSDRFGLWLGFHPVDQDTYLLMIKGYADALGLAMENDARSALEKESLAWSITRGSRSGRVAWQFIIDAASKAKMPIDLSKL